MAEFKISLNRRNITKEEILNDLKECAKAKESNTFTAKEYQDIGQYGVNTILRKFGSWNQALLEAGLTAPNRQNISNDELFHNIIDVWTSLGRQPFGRELEKSAGISKISLGTYEGRFKSWNNALIEFEKFINSNQNDETDEDQQNKFENIISTANKRRTPRTINWRLRARILIRDNCICQMCGASPAKNSDVVLHVDHIQPYSKGGETVIENLRTLCSVCNIGKSNMYEIE